MNTNAFESNDGPPTNPIRLSDPEAGLESEPQYLAAEFQCLVHVDHFQTGGIRDTVAQVIARWREVYNHVTLEVPRPNKGVHRLPFDCPMCGKPVEFRTTSWLRTNLLALCGTILLGLVLAIVGWFNIEAHGKIGVGIAVSGLTLAVGLPLLTLIVPGLLDSIPAALQIVKDVPRDPSRFPIPGSQCPDTTRHSELAASSMNQHKLVKVRLADSAS